MREAISDLLSTICSSTDLLLGDSTYEHLPHPSHFFLLPSERERLLRRRLFREANFIRHSTQNSLPIRFFPTPSFFPLFPFAIIPFLPPPSPPPSLKKIGSGRKRGGETKSFISSLPP